MLFIQVWEIEEGKHDPGSVLHTIGWPLDSNTYGGSFLYHMDDRQVNMVQLYIDAIYAFIPHYLVC